ncbi:MAG: hypothetical protein ACODAU_00405 [Myxococcota bacterium]
MKDLSQEERWVVQMAQARNFARREQYADAVARAAGIRNEVTGVLRAETDPARRARLERLLERVEKLHAQLRSQFQAWREEIERKRQARIRNAPEEMQRPLPRPRP